LAETIAGRFYLNSRPIFLRGFPINPPAPDHVFVTVLALTGT